MLSYQTALDIALCYQELKNGKALLEEVEKSIETEKRRNETQTNIRDAFGRPARGLELGVPSGAGSTRLFNVPWPLARSAIIAHLADIDKRLTILNEAAKLELITDETDRYAAEDTRSKEEYAFRNDPEHRLTQTPEEEKYDEYCESMGDRPRLTFEDWQRNERRKSQ